MRHSEERSDEESRVGASLASSLRSELFVLSNSLMALVKRTKPFCNGASLVHMSFRTESRTRFAEVEVLH
jgi:hypothetical protein